MQMIAIQLKVIMVMFFFMTVFSSNSFFISESYSQTIAGAEFFFDNDPGQGNGVALPVSDIAFDSDTEEIFLGNIDTSGLPIGVHTVNVRFKDSEGDWGSVIKSMLEIKSGENIITDAEFFFDSDPCAGNGTPMNIADGIFDSITEEVSLDNIDTSGLSPGTHTVFVRVKDSLGKWSNPLFKDLIIESPEPKPTFLSVNPATAARSLRQMIATVTVLDQNEEPMSGVTVLANTNGRRVTVTPEMAITGADGTAEFMFRFPVFLGSGEITFVADGLSATIIQQQ